jgi:glucose-1-phosphate thymidylyltransferase
MYSIVVIGIVLAGGAGTRLWPLTIATSKQLLPVYNKPLIFYPLSTLMSAGIREIVIITTPTDQSSFQKLLGDGKKYGARFHYEVQEKPEGLAQAFLIAEKYIVGKKVCLILGDNIFYGTGLGRQLSKYNNISGAQIFAYRVSNPERYGVVEFDQIGNAISIEEKPTNPRSSYAIPGLYFYDEAVLEIAKQVIPSARGELEISTINEKYLDLKKLSVEILQRGTIWFDTGTFSSLNDASTFVRAIEERQGIRIGLIEEVAFRNSWIDKEQLEVLADFYRGGELSMYLKEVSAELI